MPVTRIPMQQKTASQLISGIGTSKRFVTETASLPELDDILQKLQDHKTTNPRTLKSKIDIINTINKTKKSKFSHLNTKQPKIQSNMSNIPLYYHTLSQRTQYNPELLNDLALTEAPFTGTGSTFDKQFSPHGSDDESDGPQVYTPGTYRSLAEPDYDENTFFGDRFTSHLVRPSDRPSDRQFTLSVGRSSGDDNINNNYGDIFEGEQVSSSVSKPTKPKKPKKRGQMSAQIDVYKPITRSSSNESIASLRLSAQPRLTKREQQQSDNDNNIRQILSNTSNNMTNDEIKQIIKNVRQFEPKGKKTFVKMGTVKSVLQNQLQTLRNKYLGSSNKVQLPKKIESLPRHLNEYQMIQRVPRAPLPPAQRFSPPPVQSQEDLLRIQEQYIRNLMDKMIKDDEHKGKRGSTRDKGYMDNLKGRVIKAAISPTMSMYEPKDLNRQPQRQRKARVAKNKKGHKDSAIEKLEKALEERLEIPSIGKNPPAIFYPNNGTPFRTPNPAFNQGYVRKGYGEPLIPIRVV